MKKLFFLMIAFFSTGMIKAQDKIHSKAKDLVGQMTLEEKAKFVVGVGMHFNGPNSKAKEKDKVPGAAGSTYEIPRLGIPSITVSDGPAGVRIDPYRNGDSSHPYFATAFPVATLVASTWDTSLVKEMGVAFGSEVKDYGIDIILGPAMNIHRNPLGGRNFEYFSEDPVLTGNIAAALVNGIQSNGVGTSIKHFAANNQETNRNTINTIISERALREIYLKGFEIAVKKAQPWTVMSSYNKINGTYTSEDYDLLTTILRKEWGFKGMVMTDWFGGKDPVAQMKAGNDLLMPGMPAQSKAILDAVNKKTLDVSILDENATRVLQTVLRSRSYQKLPYSDKPPLKKDAEVSRHVAEDGMILLKNNNNTLPVNAGKKVALFGNNGYDLIPGGTGSGSVNKAYTVSLGEGLSNAGFKVDEGLKNKYSDYVSEQKAKRPKKSFMEEFMHPTPPIPEMSLGTDNIVKKAEESDIAIIAIGRNAGEGSDRKIENDFTLSTAEGTLIRNVSEAFHAKNKKVIVVLNIGGVIEVASWRDEVDAILLAWQPGQEGGNAIAALLDGKVNPSGKLATTFPMKYEDEPSARNFPGKEFPDQATTGQFGMKSIPSEVVYQEGIYVGYRYFNTFDLTPAYEFGYGLSYTNFTYKKLKLSSTNFNNQITASVEVTNTGKVAGKEVVELYISAPSKELKKPSEELKGFAKTRLLKPGETETIRFTITANDLASFYTKSVSWIAEAGNYTVKIGASSTDIRQKAEFKLVKDKVVEKDENVLQPKQEIPPFTK